MDILQLNPYLDFVLNVAAVLALIVGIAFKTWRYTKMLSGLALTSTVLFGAGSVVFYFIGMILQGPGPGPGAFIAYGLGFGCFSVVFVLQRPPVSAGMIWILVAQGMLTVTTLMIYISDRMVIVLERMIEVMT